MVMKDAKPLMHEQNTFFKPKQHRIHDPRGPEITLLLASNLTPYWLLVTVLERANPLATHLTRTEKILAHTFAHVTHHQ